MRSESQPVVNRPARLTRLTEPSAAAAAAGAMPCPIANAPACVLTSGKATAAKKRVTTSHQNGAERTAARSVHGAGTPPAPPVVVPVTAGSLWRALSGTTSATSSAADASSAPRHPTALTSTWASGMKQNAPPAVPRSTRAIARPRARGYQSAATVMFGWLLNAASPSPAHDAVDEHEGAQRLDAARDEERGGGEQGAALDQAPWTEPVEGPADERAGEAAQEQHRRLHGGDLTTRPREFLHERQVEDGERHQDSVVDGEGGARDGERAPGAWGRTGCGQSRVDIPRRGESFRRRSAPRRRTRRR